MGIEDRDWFRHHPTRMREAGSSGYCIGRSKGGGSWKWIVAVLILASALATSACRTPNDEEAELEWIKELYSQGYDWANLRAYVREHPTSTGPNSNVTTEQALANASSISRLEKDMIRHRQEAPGCLRTWGVRTSESLVGLRNSTNIETGESSPLWDSSFQARKAADSLERCSDTVRLRMEGDVLGLFHMQPFRGHLNWYEREFRELRLRPTPTPDPVVQAELRWLRGFDPERAPSSTYFDSAPGCLSDLGNIMADATDAAARWLLTGNLPKETTREFNTRVVRSVRGCSGQTLNEAHPVVSSIIGFDARTHEAWPR